MHATIHIGQPGVVSAQRQTLTSPIPQGTLGLREVRALTPAPLAGVRLPRAQLGGVATIAFWDDDASIDAYEAANPSPTEGWSTRLELLRAVPVAGGHFPGVPDSFNAPDVDADLPVVVITIALTRALRIVPFLNTNRRAEISLADAPGLMWGTGLANVGQRCMATVSLWESGTQAHSYAVGTDGHRAAMRGEAQRSFHRFGSFLRFRPLTATGYTDGRNPLPEALNTKLLTP